MKVEFWKMQATGNDFVLVDEWKNEVLSKRLKPIFAKHVCRENYSVGADGVMFISRPTLEGFEMRIEIFMPDGSESEMCGNGVRCAVRFGLDRETIPHADCVRVQSKAGKIRTYPHALDREIRSVTVDFGKPQLRREKIPAAGKGNFLLEKMSVPGIGMMELSAVNTGVPHAVVIVPDIDSEDVAVKGRAIRNFTTMFPRGVNVDFAQTHKNGVKIRTYERGVEAETLSCGTGAAASATIAFLANRLSARRIAVDTRGGRLVAQLLGRRNKVDRVLVEGPVEKVFEGELEFQTMKKGTD